MKRVIVPLLIMVASTSLTADDHTTVITLNNGSVYAIHNKDIKEISFSKYDLNEKYYSLRTDTLFMSDTIYLVKSVHDTIYVDNNIYIHDTIYVEKNMINGHEYVDLGLPSGLKWATCNIGAAKPEEYGDYYAWGETETKEEYSESNYQYCTSDGYSSYGYDYYYIVIGKNISGTRYDVARQKWGGSWRMPTEEEFKELLDNCLWQRAYENGVYGYKVSGNGNSIFLPSAGARINSNLYEEGLTGCYWSATAYTTEEVLANWAIMLNNSEIYFDFGRYNGFNIRPVI